MKRQAGFIVLVSLAAMLVATSAVAAVQKPAAFPGIFRNARFVYVTSFDGSQWSSNVLPDDRAAIGEVQDAIRTWGHFVVVQEPRNADMILVVQRRGSEDELAVYDPTLGRNSEYLWRVMGHGGLDKDEMPLFQQFRQAFEKSAAVEKSKK
jgi:hypothetical protein